MRDGVRLRVLQKIDGAVGGGTSSPASTYRLARLSDGSEMNSNSFF